MGSAQSTSTHALPFDLIDLTPATFVAYRPTLPVDHGASSGSFSAGGRIAVGPGDVLHVRVFERYEGGIFPTIALPSADLGNQRVTDDGTIDGPYGQVRPTICGARLALTNDGVEIGRVKSDPLV
jgi:polysaccharide export outer membrane protein